MMNLNKHVPFKKAAVIIAIITLLISGTTAFGLLYYLSYKAQRLHDPKYTVQAVVQTHNGGPYIPTRYFIELLGLAVDTPINLYQIRVGDIRDTLLESPILLDVDVKKIKPHTLYIAYESRTPIGIIGDAANTAMDQEGHLFPYQPFIEGQNIPRVYLGLDHLTWGKTISDPKMRLAIDLIREFQYHLPGEIKITDVTDAYALSNGKRQIVVMLNTGTAEHYLRMRPTEIESQVAQYLKLRPTISNQFKIIDFRIPQLAYLQSKENPS